MMTKNVELAVVSTGATPEGWTAEAMALASLAHTIDGYRFASETDAVLARHEGDEGLALFPSVDELIESGVELHALASALNNGLTGEAFADCLRNLDVDTLNGALANFAEAAELHATHPDPVDRAMHLWGECGCCEGNA